MVNARHPRKRRSNRSYVISLRCAFTSEINAISATIIGQLDTNFKIGRRAALREIEDVKHDTREAEDVLDVAVAIAEADGEIEPEERKVLEEIAGVLGLRLENHL